jgi:hypothetical protein
MKKAMILASAAMISIALLSGGAGAQGTPQTVELVKVDVHKLAAGYRASKVIGSSVVTACGTYIRPERGARAPPERQS